MPAGMVSPTSSYRNLLTASALFSLLLTGCFWGDDPHSEHKLTKDFFLNWHGKPSHQEIILSNDGSETNGTIVIKEGVFAVGYDDNFIIVKQHPNKEAEISDRLFGKYDRAANAYLLIYPADSIYTSDEDSIFYRNGRWYHISNGWNPPDSLNPYRRKTFYHIIDIRNYKRKTWFGVNIFNQHEDTYEIYTCENKNDFIKMRKKLGVPNALSFSIIDTELQ